MTQVAQSGGNTVRTEFFNVMRDLQGKFKAVEADVARRQEAFEQALRAVSEALTSGVGKTVLKGDHPLARAIAEVNDDSRALVETWMERVGRATRALDLRNGSEDALLVYVLGKVKAGKSSLGNAVAYGRCVPPLPAEPEPAPHFFVRADASTGEVLPFFAVGASETTTKIQGFRLAGLTWIDAPGLASVTPENGALASEYSESADLVIYPMHSGSPGRSDDAHEILKLVRACRRFLVVITCCDRCEEDETLDGQVVRTWVMKPDGDRAAQVRWVRRQLAAAGAPADTDIVTLSVRYADAHLACPGAFVRSGMAEFYGLLQQVARSEAVHLKSQAPSRNLDALVGEIIGTDGNDDTGDLALRNLEGKLQTLLTSRIGHARRDVAQRQRKLLADVHAELSSVVERLAEEHAPSQRSVEFRIECQAALQRLMSQAVHKELLALLGDADGEMVPSLGLRVAEFPPFLEITRMARRSNRGERGAAGAAVGAFAGGVAGAELGGLAGFVFPGPGNAIGAVLGGAIGAAIAGWGGRWAGRVFGEDWKEEVKTGRDNRADVKANALDALAAAAASVADHVSMTFDAAVIRPLELRTQYLLTALEEFRGVLAREVHS